MRISKLDAAQRQIDAAIVLYFKDVDAVSVHTLVGAAHILITDLSDAANQETLIKRHVKPEKFGEFEKAIRAPQNFFKHADRDPSVIFEFDPHLTELLLLVEIETFRELAGSITDAMNVFLSYAAATWGKDAFKAVPKDVLAGITEVAAQMPKREFYQLGLQAARSRAGH